MYKELINKISNFKTPSQALGVFVLPEPQKILSEPKAIPIGLIN